MSKAPKLGHFFGKEVLEHVDSAVVEAPKQENSSIKEGVLFDFARIFAVLDQFDVASHVCLFRADFFNFGEQQIAILL